MDLFGGSPTLAFTGGTSTDWQTPSVDTGTKIGISTLANGFVSSELVAHDYR